MSDDRTPPAEDDTDMEAKAVKVYEAVKAMRAALADLDVETKFLAVEHLGGWLELERKSHLPETAANN